MRVVGLFNYVCFVDACIVPVNEGLNVARP